MSEIHPARLLSFPATAETRQSTRHKTLMAFDPRSQQLQQQLDRLAPTAASVLLVGETGTGKEVAARYLHERSGRQGPFVAVNCSAFSDTLVEAELFGHETGAFTGAQHARAGWFETANGGTLFLDEIGDMPLHLQAKLLRALQERQITRIGSRKAVAIDVRLIAATNVDLHAAVQMRQFRRDLYYRLAVATVALLPLRERRGDILPLAQHFVDGHRTALGSRPVGFSASAQAALLAYDWPGNIRELDNVVHYALIMARNGAIDTQDLRIPAAALTASGDDATFESLGNALRQLIDSDRDAVYESVERLLLTTAFEHCAGNQVQTARRLGVSRNVLRTQLKRFGMLKQSEIAIA